MLDRITMSSMSYIAWCLCLCGCLLVICTTHVDNSSRHEFIDKHNQHKQAFKGHIFYICFNNVLSLPIDLWWTLEVDSTMTVQKMCNIIDKYYFAKFIWKYIYTYIYIHVLSPLLAAVGLPIRWRTLHLRNCLEIMFSPLVDHTHR